MPTIERRDRGWSVRWRERSRSRRRQFEQEEDAKAFAAALVEGGASHPPPAYMADPCEVYAIRCTFTGRIKIGISRGVRVRLAELQTGSPTELEVLATMPGDALDESVIHQSLAAHRLHGEWFAPHPEVDRAVEGLRRGRGWLAILRENMAAHGPLTVGWKP